MFHSARIKLTVWYLVIIMAISVVFSLVIYRIQYDESARLLQRQRIINQRFGLLQPAFNVHQVDPDILGESRNRLKLNLILINLGVLVFSGGAAYFLAGRTLQPIEEMVEDQKRFVADASHELRTPLATMKTELEVKLRDKKLDSATRKVLESSLEEVNKLSYLSDKLLRLGRYEQKNDIAFAEVSLKAVVEEVIEHLALAAKAKKIEIKTQLEETSIKGNFDALVEAVATIVDNSIKYSPKESTIEVHLESQNNKVFLKVKDHGIGVKASDLPHIFDRFYRADSSRTKDEVSGFGLGLAIAKAVVSRHHGKIEVESVADEGTTFTIVLPKETGFSALSQS